MQLSLPQSAKRTDGESRQEFAGRRAQNQFDLFRSEDADLGNLHFRGLNLANFVDDIAHDVMASASEMKQAVEDGLEIPSGPGCDRLAVPSFQVAQIFPDLVCCDGGNRPLKFLRKPVQPHPQITHVHSAAACRVPVLQHFGGDFLYRLLNQCVSFEVVFHGGQQADTRGELHFCRNEVIHGHAEGKV